ncbi:MAG: hypothetical protein IKE00_02300 [Oscillospiraceae bacterium]|nr:hypothetical protein [Oscillospiraceae bacterium]
MEKVIAIFWDCDNTLVDGYMQNPITDYYHLEPGRFWRDVFSIPAKHPGVKFDSETTYLNYYLDCIEQGLCPGLNNERLRWAGSQVTLFPGLPDFLKDAKELAASLGARLEHHVVFTGFAEALRGASFFPDLDGWWGCEMAEGPDADGNPVLKQPAYTLDNLTKARAFYEVHAGMDSHDPKAIRTPVEYKNMIYVADGPGDEKMMESVTRLGGRGMTVWGDPNPVQGRGPNARAGAQALLDQGLCRACCKADYTKNGEAALWLFAQIRELAAAE